MRLSLFLSLSVYIGASRAAPGFADTSTASELVQRATNESLPGSISVTSKDPNGFELVMDSSFLCPSYLLQGVMSKHNVLKNVSADVYLRELASVSNEQRIAMTLSNWHSVLQVANTSICASHGLERRAQDEPPVRTGRMTATIMRTSTGVAAGYAANLVMGVEANTSIPTIDASSTALIIAAVTLVNAGVDELLAAGWLTPVDAAIYSVMGMVLRNLSAGARTVLRNLGRCPSSQMLEQAYRALPWTRSRLLHIMSQDRSGSSRQPFHREMSTEALGQSSNPREPASREPSIAELGRGSSSTNREQSDAPIEQSRSC
ncbi:MAG: hypothetical protein M1821_000311 [Bathelium mastoideum]|nr:MAG: hypothetical protein M1821_000311 [Bathelium mastoideum]